MMGNSISAQSETSNDILVINGAELVLGREYNRKIN